MKQEIFSPDGGPKTIRGTLLEAPTRFAFILPSRGNLAGLPTFEGDSTDVNVVVESSRSSTVRYGYNAAIDVFEMSCILPAGSRFPLDIGFIPSTLAEDGHPLNILVFTDAPACVGCVVAARPIGVIEAEQTLDGETFRSDRLIGVATGSCKFADMESIDDLNPRILDEIERFLVSYDRMSRRLFNPLGRAGRDAAVELVREAMGEYTNSYLPNLARASRGR